MTPLSLTSKSEVAASSASLPAMLTSLYPIAQRPLPTLFICLRDGNETRSETPRHLFYRISWTVAKWLSAAGLVRMVSTPDGAKILNLKNSWTGISELLPESKGPFFDMFPDQDSLDWFWSR